MEEAYQQEASMPLVPIDSFSHNWLVNCSSSEASTGNSSSLIEKDPILPPSRRCFFKTSRESSFKFVSLSDEKHSLVYADELFCDGYIVPYGSKATSANTHEESEAFDTKTRGVNRNSSPFCKKLRKKSKWALLKYLNCLTPLCTRLRRCTSAETTSSRSRVYSDETTSPPVWQIIRKMKREPMEEV